MSRHLIALRPRHFCLLAGLGLAFLGLVLWPSLPPVSQDEYLSLFPIAWFDKEPEARSSALSSYSDRVLGHVLPLRSYPYVGAVKAYAYAATFLPTTIEAYRASKLALVLGLFSIVLLGCWKVSRGSPLAAGICLAWLLSDVTLVVLGICDAGTMVPSLVFGCCLFALLLSAMDSPRWWKILPIALVVFLGEWDRVNFLWFVASGLAACAAASVVGPPGRSIGGMTIAVIGCALGLAGTALLIPDYPKMVLSGAENSIGIFDWPALWEHWTLLFTRLDPFGAYHLYVDVASPVHANVYEAYRWISIMVYLAIILAGLVWALVRLRKRPEVARPLIFLSAFMAFLLYLIVKTSESWGSHHVMALKPFTYIGLGVLAAAVYSAPRVRRPLGAALILLWLGHTVVSFQGFREMTNTPSIMGVYDVSWNQADAWQAAARAPVKAVYALDWGVFYPGVVNSPADQRWEMPTVSALNELLQLDAARKGLDMGLLFHTKGSRRWILDAPNAQEHYGITDIKHFAQYPGEPWTLAILSVDRWTTPAGRASGMSDLVHNGTFADGSSVWRYEEFEVEPQTVDWEITGCDIEGLRSTCAVIDHRAPGDSRIVQPIVLEPGVVIKISAWVRAEQVDLVGKGVHLVLLDHYEAESAELHGTTEWQALRFYVVNSGAAPKTVQLAARLGTWGSLVGGQAWFSDIKAQAVDEPESGFPLFVIDLTE
jgi:hypothetical protein